MAHSLVHSVDVDSPPGAPRIRVLFYDDGYIRFRIYAAPLAIEEAYLAGNQHDHAIIGVQRKDKSLEEIGRKVVEGGRIGGEMVKDAFKREQQA